MTSQQSPPKRPRLSLQIKTSCSPATRSSRSYAADPQDPTAYNTLSNVYLTAIERAAPVQQAEPVTAISKLESFSLVTPIEYQDPKQRVVTPYAASYPETPLTAHPISPVPMGVNFPSTMTATPPLSAGPIEPNVQKVFSFSAQDTSAAIMEQTQAPHPEVKASPARTHPRRLNALGLQAPYTHPRSLHSILRNSPLPPPTAIIPPSPRRQSLRLQEKAAKKVGYNNPLTQEITTNKYTKSHIDLLVEEASPQTPPSAQLPETVLDLALAFTPNEIQDGGQTPGPFEDMRRRLAGLESATPVSPAGPAGIRKRKRKEKKRRWVWTIGQDGDEEEIGGSIATLRKETSVATGETKTPVTAILVSQAAEVPTPTPSIETSDSGCESYDVEMSDTSSCRSVSEAPSTCASEMEVDQKTPIAPRPRSISVATTENRDTPIPDELNPRASSAPGVNRDTPIPPELVQER